MKKKLLIPGILFLFVSTIIIPAFASVSVQSSRITWECLISCSETNNGMDTVVFGEATDANDGPPADGYDVAKPPTPVAPYVRAYFRDNLPVPYSSLWTDYRRYPDSYKVWNLSVQWMPLEGDASTVITLSWESSILIGTEYSTIDLCTSTGTPLRDMRTENQHTFTCPAFVLQHFKIIAQKENTAPAQPNKPVGETSGYHGSSYVYTTSTIDPDGDDVYYQYDWGNNVQSSWLGPFPSGVAMQTSYRWNSPGTYAVRVRARDVYGSQSSWSISLSVTMMNRAPFPPIDPIPSNTMIDIQRNPVLYWTGMDPDGDILCFDVYFGTQNPPSKVVSNQSSSSFSPGVLSYKTTYFWMIQARDGFGGMTNGPLWSFSTISADGGSSEPSDGDLNQTNFPPIADASRSEQNGFVGSLLVFNGSASYDPDGYLTAWNWDFGDGTTGNGEVTMHLYETLGLFTVTLTVIDEKGAIGVDSITVEIGTANRPPRKPLIDGPRTGLKNQEYVYSVFSEDPENDFLSYLVIWGDGTQNSSELVPHNTSVSFAHSWARAGKYLIIATASDTITWSEKVTWEVFIDVFFVNALGFLFDTDADELYDSFYVNASGMITAVQRLENGSVILDTTGDGKWDFLFDPQTGFVKQLETGMTIIENPWLFVSIIGIAVMTIACIVYLYKRQYF